MKRQGGRLAFCPVFVLSDAFLSDRSTFVDRSSMGLPPDPDAANSNINRSTPTAEVALIRKKIDKWTKYFNKSFDESQRADNSFVINFETRELEDSVEVQLTFSHRDSLNYICFSTFRFRNREETHVFRYFLSGLLVLMCDPKKMQNLLQH